MFRRAAACLPATLLTLALLAHPALGGAQEPGVKLAIGDLGLGIGDVRRLDGIRLNFRDRELELVRGVNATIWHPYPRARGVVEGVALGLPVTGAAEISGLAVGAGVGVEGDFRGLGLAALGFGSGGDLRGITVSGVGMGSGGALEGIMIAGVGMGAAHGVRGVSLAGIGLGTGGDLEGIAVGGVGLGAGGDFTGIGLGGVGMGVSGAVRGITVAGVGLGAGGGISGIAVAGVGVGSGGEIRGLAAAGVGVGAKAITGVALSGVGIGAEQMRGVALAPAYFRVAEGGSLRGVSVSAFNHVTGVQRGLTIGLLNIADELHGVQVGLINIARNKDSFSVLPILNYHP